MGANLTTGPLLFPFFHVYPVCGTYLLTSSVFALVLDPASPKYF